MSKDLDRSEAIKWCADKKCDFLTPIYPPPSGWMWAANVEKYGLVLILTPIFTNTEDDDITKGDVVAMYN